MGIKIVAFGDDSFFLFFFVDFFVVSADGFAPGNEGEYFMVNNISIIVEVCFGEVINSFETPLHSISTTGAS